MKRNWLRVAAKASRKAIDPIQAAPFCPALFTMVVLACSPQAGDERQAACISSAGSPLSEAPPLPPPEGSVEVSGSTFDVLRAGSSTAEVVLLLQGFPHGSYDYRAALPRLAGAGYRAIAAVRDAAPTKPPEPQSARDRAGLALALADALGLSRFHVAGDATAWELARAAPGRVISVATTSLAQIAAIAELERSLSACQYEPPTAPEGELDPASRPGAALDTSGPTAPAHASTTDCQAGD
jgi:hypothetical protein